jgi:DNA topoisomerase II
MAQDFVGSNNINLLVPSGQFGTRLTGGADAASPRYIFTHLDPIARYLFPEDDDMLLYYLEDDGQMIEPKYFCPIIPLLLVNGTQGIGSGWSTFIPPHNPTVVLDYIRGKLEGRQNLPSIEPYARDFKGTITRHEDGNGYVSCGRIRQTNASTVLITELPLGSWTNVYKGHLIKLQKKGIISDFVENHTTTKVSFEVKIKPMQLERMKQAGLEKAFQLQANLRVGNMNAFDAECKIQKFNSAESIAEAYFPTRLSLYYHRRSVLLSEMEHSAALQRNKSRFIKAVSEGTIDLIQGRSSKEEMTTSLLNLGFSSKSELEAIRQDNSLVHVNHKNEEDSILDEDGNNVPSTLETNRDFEYLLKMPLSSLTVEKIVSLNNDTAKTEKELKDLHSKKPEDLWMTDLEKLAAHL